MLYKATVGELEREVQAELLANFIAEVPSNLGRRPDELIAKQRHRKAEAQLLHVEECSLHFAGSRSN